MNRLSAFYVQNQAVVPGLLLIVALTVAGAITFTQFLVATIIFVVIAVFALKTV